MARIRENADDRWCRFTLLRSALALGSAWRACGGFGQWRRGGTRRGRRLVLVIATDRASEYASGARTASRPFCADIARSCTLCLGDVARHIASALMDGARDLAGGCLRTALRFQGTRLAIQLAGAIAHHAVLIDKRARHSIDFLALPEFLPGRADIAVALVVIGKVLAREGAVGMLGFVEHGDVRLDPLLIDQPVQHLGHRRCRR